jgi:Flp pilus assembly protein TadG
MTGIISNQRGVVAVFFALILIVLIGFIALGVEAGRWYMVRSELSKSVDAAALAGASNLSNPYVTPETLALHFGYANFPSGYGGTPGTGTGAVVFDASAQTEGKFKVTGSVDSIGLLSRLFGVNYVSTNASGVARKNNVEIMMILDRSGSVAGTPIGNLRTAALAFLDFFKDTQDLDKMGLATFATSVILNPSLNHNFYSSMRTRINAMSAAGATNAEYAISQAGAQLPDRSGTTSNVQQYIIFFTDGNPTAFRSNFRRNGTNFDAVVCVTGNCTSNSDSLYNQMGYTGSEAWYDTGTLSPSPTGDGKPTATTKCKTTDRWGHTAPYLNTRWGSFSSGYPLSGYADPEYCSIPETKLNGQNGYVCTTASQMALDHVTALKARGVKIYVVGFRGSAGLNTDFLSQVASGSAFEYYTPDSSDLKEIFQKIAKDIKLRLIQ